MERQTFTGAEFLNALCERTDFTYNQKLSDNDNQNMSTLTAADWLSWLDKQDGRSKLANFVRKTSNTQIISEIGDHIIKLSSNDFSRLTDPLWSSISKEDKRIVQSVLTLPRPINHGKNKLTFSEIHIPTTYQDLGQSIDAAINILKAVQFDMFSSPQMLTFLDLIIKAINKNILKKDMISYQITLNILRSKLLVLFFILLHPEYHDKIKGLSVFINFMISVNPKDEFDLYRNNRFYENLKTLANSADIYFKQKLNKDENIIQIQNEAEEQEWWNKICSYGFTDEFQNTRYNTNMLNAILKDNPFFMDEMTICAQNISLTSAEALILWQKISDKFVERGICKDSKETGHIATLFYQLIGVPCLDILESDKYVNELSDDDKELLTLWTHACNLLQKKTPTAESIATKAEMDEVPDITRKGWLRYRLHQIFLQSPKTKSDFVLYRGLDLSCNRVNRFSHNPIAASYDKKVAEGFAYDPDENGCILRITVPKQSNILAIDRVSIYKGEEKEILLMPNSNLIDSSEKITEEITGAKPISVKLTLNKEANNQIQPLSKPHFVHREMSLDEYSNILITSKTFPVFVPTNMTQLEMLDKLTVYFQLEDPSFLQNKYDISSDLLFKAIRTWALLYCGFGDVQLAISEFWKVSFSIYIDSPKIDILNRIKLFCDCAWASKKSLVTHNKAAASFDIFQEFVRPFIL